MGLFSTKCAQCSLRVKRGRDFCLNCGLMVGACDAKNFTLSDLVRSPIASIQKISVAKMFYTLDETKAALGRDEKEIRGLAREGQLREFRDGSRIVFKADQVNAMWRRRSEH